MSIFWGALLCCATLNTMDSYICYYVGFAVTWIVLNSSFIVFLVFLKNCGKRDKNFHFNRFELKNTVAIRHHISMRTSPPSISRSFFHLAKLKLCFYFLRRLLLVYSDLTPPSRFRSLAGI